jgi:hypothetical protein
VTLSAIIVVEPFLRLEPMNPLHCLRFAYQPMVAAAFAS